MENTTLKQVSSSTGILQDVQTCSSKGVAEFTMVYMYETDWSHTPLCQLCKTDVENDAETHEPTVPAENRSHPIEQASTLDSEDRFANLPMLSPPWWNSSTLYPALPSPWECMTTDDTSSREGGEKLIQVINRTKTISAPLSIYWPHWKIPVCLQGHPRAASRMKKKYSPTLILYITATLCLLLYVESPLQVLPCDTHSSCEAFNLFMGN